MLSKNFLLAGRASFIVANPQGETVTVRVSKARTKVNPRTGQPYPVSYYVSLRHNNDAWTYLGVMTHDLATVSFELKTTSRSTVTLTDRLAKIAAWGIAHIWSGAPVPTGYRLAHTGRCGRCGKMLRDEESIRLGLGPVCRG